MAFLIRASLGVATALLISTAGCGDTGDDDGGNASGDEGGGSATVEVDDNLFEPDSVEVTVGDTVTWDWVGSEPHNVSADGFKSDIQQEGTFEHTFDAAGSYPYVCTVHPGMNGTIDVS